MSHLQAVVYIQTHKIEKSHRKQCTLIQTRHVTQERGLTNTFNTLERGLTNTFNAGEGINNETLIKRLTLNVVNY